MIKLSENIGELCVGCVYYPPNLPENAYPAEDWAMLRDKACSYDFIPGDPNCEQTRKIACSIVDLSRR